MTNDIKSFSSEDFFKFGTPNIEMLKRSLGIHVFPCSARKIVNNNEPMTLPDEGIDDVRSYETGSSRYQNIH
jgi:hypothetical protein